MNKPILVTTVVAAGLFGSGVAVGQITGIPFSLAASPVATATTTQTTPDGNDRSFPPHGSAAHEATEKALTGSAASRAQAAAVKHVGSGTAGAVTADFQGNGYEVTVTKSDGTTVEVHLDSSFNVQAGFGGHGDGDGDGPGASGTNG